MDTTQKNTPTIVKTRADDSLTIAPLARLDRFALAMLPHVMENELVVMRDRDVMGSVVRMAYDLAELMVAESDRRRAATTGPQSCPWNTEPIQHTPGDGD